MILVASTYVADVLNDSLKNLLQKFCDQQIMFHYNQVFQQALLPDSEFNENTTGLNVILIRLADVLNPNQKSHTTLDDLSNALTSLQKSTRVPVLVLITPSQAATPEEKNDYSEVELHLGAVLEANKNILFLSSEEILTKHNNESVFDAFTEQHGHIPYTREFYDTLAVFIGRTYSLLTRKPYKAIVLDCDGTLWKGVIEEDGLDGIIIDDESRAFQQFIVSLFEAGFLICLCSKNSEQSVLEALQHHKDMVLDIQKHICSYRINWLPKSVNLRSLADELNLGLDSFIFIDDNNIECAEVKAAVPDVLAIELSTACKRKGETSSRLEYLKNIWAFDVQVLSEEDKQRTVFYKQNKLRETLRSESLSYEQVLKNLGIETRIFEANEHDLKRVIQLSQRTNQFNLFPGSVSAVEFNERVLQKKTGCLVVNVSDKYGDYGLVGVVVYDIQAEELVIKSLFLSCRILGRGVEYAVIQHMVRIAEQHAVNKIRFLFAITERNIPAIGFLQHLSHQASLQDLDELLLTLKQLKKVTPKLIQHAEKKTKPLSTGNMLSNEYMLEIARESLNRKRQKVHASDKLVTIEMSLMELFRQHKLWIEEKNIPLIDLGITSLHCVDSKYDLSAIPY